MNLTLEDLRRVFHPTHLEQGGHYAREGKVEILEFLPERGIYSAAVTGSRSSPYLVYARVSRMRDGLHRVDGDCTCTVAVNCKHVAATLLTALGGDEGEAPHPVGGPLGEWLRALDQAATARDAEPLPTGVQRLSYILSLRDNRGLPDLRAAVLLERPSSKGHYGQPVRLGSGSALGPMNDVSVPLVDRSILRGLVASADTSSRQDFSLAGYDGVLLVERMVATGRAYWGETKGPSLSRGQPCQAYPGWRLEEDGRQRLVWDTDQGSLRILPLTPPWYFDSVSGRCGPLVTGLADALAAVLARSPALEPREAEACRRELVRRVPGIPAPREVAMETISGVIPQPRLRLHTLDIKELGGEGPIPVARLDMVYPGITVCSDSARETVLRRGDAVVRLIRATGPETDLRNRLPPLRLLSLAEVVAAHNGGRSNLASEQRQTHTFPLEEGAQPWLTFQWRDVPKLRQEGWEVELGDDFPYRLAGEPNSWYANMETRDGSDWFSLELGIEVGGRRINLLPILLDLLSDPELALDVDTLARLPAGEHLMIPLEDGTFLPLPADRTRDILLTLMEIHATDHLDGRGLLVIPTFRANQIAELEAALPGVVWQGGEVLLTLGRYLGEPQDLANIKLPKDFSGNLRPYQAQGLAWMQFLRENGLSGVLADDMGLGKTVQTLAHLAVEQAAGRATLPSLVVAPTSLMTNWRREAERFAPRLRVLTLHGATRHQHFDRLADYDLVLTTYALLPRDAEVLLEQVWHLVILDEAQIIKNPRAQATRIANDLACQHRLCLSGTPMENHLGELWSIFNFLMPGLLGDENTFRRFYRIPIERGGDSGRRTMLARRLKPFLLRRTKQEVAADLPPKTEILRLVELEGPQRDLYESIRLAMHKRVREAIERQGTAGSHLVILEALLKLRQVCCDPRLLSATTPARRSAAQSAKLDLLMDLVPAMVEEGRRILLFSQFTTMLGLIAQEMRRSHIPFVELTGATRDRANPVERFQAGEVPVFLISLKAGGTGLNLTAADTVIHYDPWWNPAVEAQATDRAHRIGQDKAVFVYKLITQGTVEERILALQERKADLARGLFEDSGQSLTLDEVELEALFAPLL